MTPKLLVSLALVALLSPPCTGPGARIRDSQRDGSELHRGGEGAEITAGAPMIVGREEGR